MIKGDSKDDHTLFKTIGPYKQATSTYQCLYDTKPDQFEAQKIKLSKYKKKF